MKHFYMLALLCSAVTASHAQSFLAQYGTARTPQTTTILNDFRQGQVLEKIASALSRGMHLPRPITLIATDCGKENAYYTPKGEAIVLCLELVVRLRDGIGRDFARTATPAEIPQIFSGALIFVLMHEIGHALINQFDLPVLGREEDAADQIGIFFLLGNSAASQSLAGALWFFRPNNLLYTQQHFSDEHSLNPQRQANFVCWAYGRDQTKFAYLLRSPFLSAQRAARCPGEYQKLDSVVRRLLDGKIALPPRS